MPIAARRFRGVLLLLLACHLAASDKCDSSKTVKLYDPHGSINVTIDKNQTCRWEFDISSAKDVYVIVEELMLAPGDVAEFFKSADSKVLQQTGTRRSFVVALPASNSSFTLDSTLRSLDSPSSLILKYASEGCQMDVKADAAEISAPYFRSPMNEPWVSCKYKISGDLENQVWSFKEVDLQKGHIVFKSGNTTYANFTAGTNYSPDVIVKGRETMINISMASSKNQAGFVASYVFLEEGPKKIDLEDAVVTVYNPGFPYGYLGDQDIRWNISAPKDQYVNITVNDVDLADASDVLLIVDGDSLYGKELVRFTGDSKDAKGSTWLSSNSSVLMRFKSNTGQQTSRGFSVTISPELFSRSVQVTEDPVNFLINTSISSKLPTSDKIIYQMSVPEDERVQVTLTHSLLLPLSIVKFYEDRSLLAEFITQSAFYPVVSNGNKVVMVVEGFDENGTNQYLEGSVTKVKKSESQIYRVLTEKEGVLEYKATNGTVNATWIIQNFDDNEEVSLSIKQLKLPRNFSLSVYNGPSDYDTCILTLEGDQAEADVFPTIRAKHMRVELMDDREKHDPQEASIEFEAIYGTESACKEFYESDVSEGLITTPGYPNQYPYNELCEWKMNTPNEDIVHVYFDTFQVFSEHKFTIDVSTTANSGNHSTANTSMVLSASGDKVPDDLVMSDLSSMTFTFDSQFDAEYDDYHVGQGVKAYFEYLSCGGNVTMVDGSLSSPGFPANVSNATRCIWVVTLPPPSDNSSVSILKFKLYAGLQGNDASINTLMIRDGGSKRAPPVSGNLTQGQEIMSRSNIIWVEYVFEPADKKSKGFPFQLNYTTYVCPPSQQCKNGICMHPDWKCDGYDQCGDHSDEDDCTCVNTKSGAVSYLALGMSIFATFVIAILIACVAPIIYKKVRYGNYNELRDFMTPVPT